MLEENMNHVLTCFYQCKILLNYNIFVYSARFRNYLNVRKIDLFNVQNLRLVIKSVHIMISLAIRHLAKTVVFFSFAIICLIYF